MSASRLQFRSFAVALALLATASCGEGELDVEAEVDDVTLSSEESELRTNTNPNRLVVYSNNIENMLFDWKDLVHAMGRHELKPDIFLVQQLSGREELQRLTSFMGQRLRADYTGVVAQNRPADERFSPDVRPKPKVTTGVVWRSSRFELVRQDSWMPFGRGFKNQRQSCDERSWHSGYETIRVKLFDRLAKKHVVVMSLRHWTWEPCSTKNVLEIVNGFDGGPNDHAGLGRHSDLHIVGGDFNDNVVDGDGDYKCWYRQMVRGLGASSCAKNVDLGFTDPLFEACDGERSCVRRRGGIDSLFVRRPDGKPVRTEKFDVVSFEDGHRASVASTGGDGPSNVKSRDGYDDVADRYSGHQARRAHVFYE
ncbi:MAG: hypothetical protein ACK4N5_15285 [Myxococcales bacterium]